MEIHIRTTVRYDYSYISSAALQIGDEILEVGGWGTFMINGVMGTNDAELPATFAGFPFVLKRSDQKTHIYHIPFGTDGQLVQIKTFKDWVSVSIEHATVEDFGTSTGLMGDFATGHPLARDGTTVLSLMEDEVHAFGQEWQVRDTDVQLFDNCDRAPQFPAQCVLPTHPMVSESQRRRRLGQVSDISQEAAELACAYLATTKAQELCQYDVRASGDLEMAQAGAF